MDQRLVAWARAVKARAVRSGSRHPVPPLWLFTDAARMPDLLRVVRALPPGLCGVVFRHDGAPDRAALGRQVLRACRGRRLWMTAAPPYVPGAGRHLRRGARRGGGTAQPLTASAQPVTASAHGVAELVRARRAGATAVFLSPLFPTASHPGSPALGPLRWSAMAVAARPMVHGPALLALGGIEASVVRRLPPRVGGVGAITALLAP
jgi:thiamine-phosphate pyrophosphorylase